MILKFSENNKSSVNKIGAILLKNILKIYIINQFSINSKYTNSAPVLVRKKVKQRYSGDYFENIEKIFICTDL